MWSPIHVPHLLIKYYSVLVENIGYSDIFVPKSMPLTSINVLISDFLVTGNHCRANSLYLAWIMTQNGISDFVQHWLFWNNSYLTIGITSDNRDNRLYWTKS